jgi:outer membrane lipoprotein-sorting protein
MKTPLEKQLEKAYQIFNRDHARLREQLISSVSKPEAEFGQIEPPQRIGPSLGGRIMTSKAIKIAAGIILVGIIAVGISHFIGSKTSTGVAFGQVIRQIQHSSYTFDMTTIIEGEAKGTIKAMVRQPGRLRWDATELMGGMSAIVDFNTGKRLFLFHGQKTAMTEIPGAEKVPEGAGPLSLFKSPAENLWNLQDGTEKYLGEKEIDGQPADGFQVQQEGKDYQCEIIVWAHAETGSPIRVEITIYNPENPSESMMMEMSNFDLNTELDEELFSLEPPPGYTLAYQKTLDETVTATESTPQAQKIERSLTLWTNGEEDESVQTLLSVDWTKPIEFSDNMYLFSMTEKGYIALNPADQQKVMQEITDSMRQIGYISRKIWELAEAARTQGNYERAEKYLNRTLELGRLITRDPEGVMASQSMGLSIQRKSLDEMATIYTQTGNQEKLQEVEKQIQEVDTQRQSFLEDLKSKFGG